MAITRTLLLLLLLTLTACQEIPADRLYALPLPQPPTEADWERALPRVVTVRGGRLHRLSPLPDLQADTVHASTASCHHGATLPDPLPVDLRAFYAAGDLYLRLSWPDTTRDESIMQWRFDGAGWRNDGNLEDGLGLVWDGGGYFPRFTCAVACHIRDFGVAGASFHATNRMQLRREGEWLDLWHWKAQRTGRFGFADDRLIDHQGMRGDLPGELFRENSRARLTGGNPLAPFAEGDGPIYDGDGAPIGPGFRLAGTTAPGYLTERPTAGRGEVTAWSVWRNGRWTLYLRRPLTTGDPHDARFVPGDRDGVAFGLAVLDHTLNEHYASVIEERLVLLTHQP